MTKKTKAPAKKPAAPAPAAPAETTDQNKLGKVALVDQVAATAGLPRKQAEGAVNAMLEAVAEALRAGKSVGLPGLGTLTVKTTAARTGVKPGTSERLQIPAGKKVAFKVATTLKGAL